MPSQASSSDSNDLASKYNHLLQPIRDLTKNWDIDVAAQLEEYLAEIERIKISFDGGKTSMNFAEAALLIQGSACIYSKKVEYLYTLVYQTLDLIASKKRLQQASSVDDQGKDKDASFRDDSVEFLLLDDIKEAKNIDLKEDESDSHKEGSQIIPRTPLVLLPLGEKDKEDVLLSRTGEVLGSRNDFKMNTCRVHASGTLLLDLTNLPLLDNSFKPLLSSAASSASKDPEPVFDEQHANLDPENEGNFEVVDLPAVDDDFEEPELMDDSDCTGEHRLGENDIENEQERQEERRALRARGTPQFATVNNLPVKDPWKLLDPYDPGVWKDKPSKKGKPFKKPLSLVSQQKKKRKRQEIKKEPVLIPINQFISQAYYSHASKMVKNPLKTPAFPEFEYLYWIEFRRQQKVQAKQKQLLSQLAVDEEIEELKSIVVKPEEEDGVANEEPGFDDDQVAADYDDDDFVGGDGLPLVEGDVPATIEPMGLEDLAEGVVVSSYEELVRQYVDGYLIEAQQYAQETDLSRRVRNWEDRILPILSEEETHRPFDIHKYGEEIMTSFKEKSNQAFRELAHGKVLFAYSFG